MFMQRLFILLVILFSQLSYAEPSHPDPQKTDIYLMTVGLGPNIEMRYGHTILQIIDHKNDRIYNLNWGTFDFSDPLLPLNFFLGKLKYWLSNWSHSIVKKKYEYFEKRTVYRQKINLSDIQKEQILNLVAKNLEPDNIYFWYHFFYKNCATFPRDLLDQVSGGAIRNSLNSLTNTNFRYYVRYHLSSPFYLSFFLDIVMNSTIDYEITKWEESFYPLKLSEHLSNLPAFDINGQAIAGSKLLSSPELIYQGNEQPPQPLRLPHWLGISFIILALLFVRFFSNSKARVLWKIGLTIWLFFSTVLGITMTLSWIFSEHEVLWHNANLWLFWPIDILAIFLIPGLFKKFNKKIFVFALAHLVGLVCAFGLWLTGFIQQDLSYVMLFSLPGFTLFYGPMLIKSKSYATQS